MSQGSFQDPLPSPTPQKSGLCSPHEPSSFSPRRTSEGAVSSTDRRSHRLEGRLLLRLCSVILSRALPPPGPRWLRELQPSRPHPRQQGRQRGVAHHQFHAAHHARLVGQELHAPPWAGRQGPEVSYVGALPRHTCCGRREHWLFGATSRPLPLTLWL